MKRNATDTGLAARDDGYGLTTPCYEKLFQRWSVPSQKKRGRRNSDQKREEDDHEQSEKGLPLPLTPETHPNHVSPHNASPMGVTSSTKHFKQLLG